MTDYAVPVLPSSDLEKTRAFYRYFDFEAVAGDDRVLRLRRDTVELAFAHSDERRDPADPGGQAMCLIRVADVEAWHALFSRARVRWKMFGGPSLTSVTEGAWGVPAFCLTDKDANLIWIVDGAPAVSS